MSTDECAPFHIAEPRIPLIELIFATKGDSESGPSTTWLRYIVFAQIPVLQETLAIFFRDYLRSGHVQNSVTCYKDAFRTRNDDDALWISISR